MSNEIINQYIELFSYPICLRKLRYMVRKYGCINRILRIKCWKYLLYINNTNKNFNFNLERNNNIYYDQIKKDINRSLCNLDILLGDSSSCSLDDNDSELKKREKLVINDNNLLKKREKLFMVINYILQIHSNKIHYVQGYHDIASIFLLATNYNLQDAFLLIEAVSLQHLSDFLQPNLHTVIELINNFLFPLIKLTDKKFYDFLIQSEVLPYFALSWVLTWFSHNINNFSNVLRLFDLFIASPPMMPLYTAASIMLYKRSELLSGDYPCEFTAIHSFFQNNFPQEFDNNNLEMIINISLDLFYHFPPSILITLSNLPSSSFLFKSNFLCEDCDELFFIYYRSIRNNQFHKENDSFSDKYISYNSVFVDHKELITISLSAIFLFLITMCLLSII